MEKIEEIRLELLMQRLEKLRKWVSFFGWASVLSFYGIFVALLSALWIGWEALFGVFGFAVMWLTGAMIAKAYEQIVAEAIAEYEKSTKIPA